MKLPLPPKPVGPFLKIGGAVDRTCASLRFHDDRLDPERVTRLLGCPPTSAHRKGDLLPSKRYQRTALTGSWSLKTLKGDARTLEAQIAGLLNSVTDDLQVWEQLTQDYGADLFCGLFLDAWNRGLSLSPDLLKRIADRHLTIGFDIYGGGDGGAEPTAEWAKELGVTQLNPF